MDKSTTTWRKKHKRTTSFKMHMVPLYTYEALCKWSDISMMRNPDRKSKEKWILLPGGFDPMFHFIKALEKVLFGYPLDTNDYVMLQMLRKDLFKTREDFIRLKIEGLTGTDKEGGGQ